MTAQEAAAAIVDADLAIVVADVGHPVGWVPSADKFDFWKREARARIVAPDAHLATDDLPGGHAYHASLWALDTGGSALVLEKVH